MCIARDTTRSLAPLYQYLFLSQLDGLPYRGTPLKIRRPIDYQPHLVPQSGLPIPHLTLTKIGIADKTASDKLFVGSIPYHLTEDQVREGIDP